MPARFRDDITEEDEAAAWGPAGEVCRSKSFDTEAATHYNDTQQKASANQPFYRGRTDEAGIKGTYAGIIAAVLLCAVVCAARLDLLCLGDAIAGSLGVRAKRLRTLALLLASAAAAAAVSFAGLVYTHLELPIKLEAINKIWQIRWGALRALFCTH